MTTKLLNKEQRHVVKVVNFGNILEWFDVYSFSYLATSLAKKFFPFQSSIDGLLLSFLVFGLGFITRPIGGIIFGRIGDHIGRKRAFILSIVTLTVPTFIMGILPTYEIWGIYAPISLCILRILQAIPTGGEIPGTICYLFENANNKNRRFMTSWSAVGNQIGAIVAILENFAMENLMSPEFLEIWGWRISFISGGFIGLFGIYLRHTLHETPVFKNLQKTHRIDHETVLELLTKYMKKIIIGTSFGAIDASTFYLIATYIPVVIGGIIGFTNNQVLFVSLFILIVTTIFLPLFGYLGDKISNKLMCSVSAIIVIALLYPLALAFNYKSTYLLTIIGILFLIPISCITALIGFQVGNLFPDQVRFTGTGVAMNLADGIIGGFTPAIALFLLQLTGKQTAFCWYVLACAIISLISYLKAIKE